MQTPQPVREHRELEKLAGHFAGPERMHASYFNDEAKKAEAVTDARVALDGFAVVQDYEQRLEDGSRFAGHGVFRYDMASETYEMHWFDSTGGPERIFRGGFEGNKLVLTARVGEGWQRLTYDFNLEKGYRMKLETSEDGQRWKVALESDNVVAGKTSTRKSAAAKKTSAKKTAGKTAAAKKTTRKASAKKATAKKATARKASPKKTSSKKMAAAKSSARRVAKKKTSARKAAAKTTPVRATAKKKAGAKKTASRKAGSRKVASKKTMTGKKTAKKAATKKATAKKTTAKKATAKKATAKKATAKKATAKKATAKKATAKKATARKLTVAPIEKQRRQGRASRKIGTKKHARVDGGAAASTPVSQKRTKGAAHKGPRMPNLKSTSTRVGWHKTAAKGVRGN